MRPEEWGVRPCDVCQCFPEITCVSGKANSEIESVYDLDRPRVVLKCQCCNWRVGPDYGGVALRTSYLQGIVSAWNRIYSRETKGDK